MDELVEGPAGKMAFEQMLARFVCMDVLVHTWDLARAVGGDEQLDEGSVTQAYRTLKPMDEQIRQPGFFGPKLDTSGRRRRPDRIPVLRRPSGLMGIDLLHAATGG